MPRASSTEPVGQQFANTRTRNQLAIDHHRLDDLQTDAGPRAKPAQHVDRARAAVAEIKIRPFDHFCAPQPIDDDPLKKILGG